MRENSPVHQLGNSVDRPWGVSEIGGNGKGGEPVHLDPHVRLLLITGHDNEEKARFSEPQSPFEAVPPLPLRRTYVRETPTRTGAGMGR